MKRIAITLLALVSVLAAEAAKPKTRPAVPRRPQTVVRAAPAKPSGPVETRFRKVPYVGAISVDAKTGNVVFEANSKVTAYPASVTKLMTALIVLEEVKAGRYSLDDQVTATADVYKSEPSWVGLKVDEKMSVRDLLTALMVESANDAAIALGVNSAGSLDAFTAKMNARARALGMTDTVYYNPNGLPPKARKYPWKSFNVTTASDQAKLALALVNGTPRILDFTSVKTCDLVKTAGGYRISVTRRVNVPDVRKTQLAPGESIVKSMKNHNNIMRTDKLKIVNTDGTEAVDGMKTGYIDAGGSSIVLTGACKGRRAVVVVLGSATSELRDTEARRLLLDALGAMSW